METIGEEMMSCCRRKDVQTLKKLWRTELNPQEYKDDVGNTFLHTAVIYRSYDCMSFLLENGSDVYSENFMGYTPLSMARWDARSLYLLEMYKTEAKEYSV